MAGGCAVLAISGACVGNIGDRAPGGSDGPGVPAVIPTDEVPASGLRRLSESEYYNTVVDLLGDSELPVFELLPTDARTPFDNDYGGQIASQGLIDAADYIAELAADRLVADASRRDEIVGCVPSGPEDEACLRSFVAKFGRRAMRRSLADDEVDAYVLGIDGADGALAYAIEANDFYVAIHDVVWAMLQDPQFLYRTEIGTAVPGQPGVYRLTDVEVASRLSYFIWGSMPDDALLDRAETGKLHTPDKIRAVAEELLQDQRARKRVDRFHAMWLGYDQLPYGGQLATDMRAETSALIARVVFEEKLPWQQLFLSNETYVTDFLADHYGLPPPGSAKGAWVKYDDGPGGIGRAGLLAHGSFLSIGAKFNDTSPVKRGRAIRERLMCQEIGDPPPNVNVDAPVMPKDAVCKPERFAQHRQGGCASCHNLMDPLGFGLEAYDQFGVFRSYETDNPDTDVDESMCKIEAQGELEQAKFSGPAELGKLLVDTGTVTDCVTTQLYRFVSGRSELDTVDRHVVELIRDSVGNDFTFAELVLAVVSQPSFAYRTQE